MRRYMALHEQGLRMGVTRYEDLTAAPAAICEALFDHCGLVLPAPAELERVLANDSQAGSLMSGRQARLQSEAALSEADLAQIRAFLAAEPVINRPDFVAPGTIERKE